MSKLTRALAKDVPLGIVTTEVLVSGHNGSIRTKARDNFRCYYDTSVADLFRHHL